MNLRALALDILLAVNEEGQYSHLVLRQVLEKHQYLPRQERAFLTRLVNGTLERQVTLDYVIDAYSQTKVHKMKRCIRNVLRLSAYQILYMDSVPDAAAVSEAVRLTKKRGYSALSGFVNAVLRKIAREGRSLRFPDRADDPVSALSVQYSVPAWIVRLWIDSCGMGQTERILDGFSGGQGFFVRVNTERTTAEQLAGELRAEGIAVEPAVSVNNALFLSGVDYLNGLAAFREGRFYVQDISSMRVAELAGVREGDHVIDVCAAPGGKSLHLAELMRGTGLVEARDLTDYKLGLIRDNIARQGARNVRAVRMDATVHDDASVEQADVLICDLPCSGLGVLGKKPDIRYRMTEEKTKELVLLQREILGAVQDYAKHGGTLVYSTCTINPAENEQNVAWLTDEYPEYELVYQEQMFPGGENRDGFFLAKLKRR